MPGRVLTIVGHTERRDAQRESDAEVKAKAEAALAAGLDVILCVGESLAVREAGACRRDRAGAARRFASAWLEQRDRARHRLRADLGDRHRQDPDPLAKSREMHAAHPRPGSSRYGSAGTQIRILYGGSVKASNAAEIFAIADVDGALVGGASLKAADFMPIVAAAASAG